MLNYILADTAISISDLKENPMSVLETSSPVAVLHHNKPVYYCVPSNVWEAINEQLEDMELKELVEKRESRSGRTFTKVNIEDFNKTSPRISLQKGYDTKVSLRGRAT